MKIKNNQKGFGLIESLLVILVVALIGGAGYFVWQNKHTKDDEAQQSFSNSATQKNATDSTDKYENNGTYTTYTNKNPNFSIDIPTEITSYGSCKTASNGRKITGETQQGTKVFDMGNGEYIIASAKLVETQGYEIGNGWSSCTVRDTSKALLQAHQNSTSENDKYYRYNYHSAGFSIGKATSDQDILDFASSNSKGLFKCIITSKTDAGGGNFVVKLESSTSEPGDCGSLVTNYRTLYSPSAQMVGITYTSSGPLLTNNKDVSAGDYDSHVAASLKFN